MNNSEDQNDFDVAMTGGALDGLEALCHLYSLNEKDTAFLVIREKATNPIVRLEASKITEGLEPDYLYAQIGNQYKYMNI